MMKWIIRSGIMGFWLALITFFLMRPSENPEISARTLNICAWPDAITESTIAAFEKSHNVKINVSYFTSNEELLTMMRLVEGREYDLVVPSDYAVKILKEEGLLKRIDKTRIKAFSEIDTFLLGYDYDKNNDYSVPIQWEVIGYGIDTDFFTKTKIKPSLELLFAPPKGNYKISMSNDPVEAINLASLYLFGHLNPLTPIEMDSVVNLLVRQKKWIESYGSMRPDYILATKNAPLAYGQSSHLVHANTHSPFIDFTIPSDAPFLSIESIALTSSTEKDDLIYEFINSLLTEDSLTLTFEEFGCFPSIKLETLSRQKQYEKIRHQMSSSPVYFFRHTLPENEIRNIWIKVKS